MKGSRVDPGIGNGGVLAALPEETRSAGSKYGGVSARYSGISIRLGWALASRSRHLKRACLAGPALAGLRPRDSRVVASA